MLSIGADGMLIQPAINSGVNEQLLEVGKPVVYFDCDLLALNAPG